MVDRVSRSIGNGRLGRVVDPSIRRNNVERIGLSGSDKTRLSRDGIQESTTDSTRCSHACIINPQSFFLPAAVKLTLPFDLAFVRRA